MSPLMDHLTLATLLGEPGAPVLLDVRWRLGGPPGIDIYRQGHLPGAVYVDLDRDLAAPPGPGRHPLPAPDAFQTAMRRCGVSADSDVVVYDDADATAAARAWWLLRYFGHRRVRVLDGGYRAWALAGLPITRDAPTARMGNFTAASGGVPMLDAAGAAALARAGVLLDARAPERYRGETEPVDPVPGHIPGAVSAPAAGNVDDQFRFRSPEALRVRFTALGVVPGRPVGAYCGSGVVASQEILALEVAGIRAALYVGSWSEWIIDPTRPIATGRDTG